MRHWNLKLFAVLTLGFCLVSGVPGLVPIADTATIKQLKYETITSVMTTELNSLANNARAISAAMGGDATDANLLGDWELAVTFGVAPTLDATIDLYLVRAADGTNYEDGDASIRPQANAFVGSFQARAVTTAQRLVIPDVPMPPGLYKAVIHNNATGQAFAASGNTLKVRTHNRQVSWHYDQDVLLQLAA